MPNCRYIRMAGNDQGWERPHGGRRGGEDYVGVQGLGHEDWNFTRDVWEDGRHHLYLRSTPAGFQNGRFNFVLGAHARPVPLIIGFVENAKYGVSELPEQVVLRRAQEVFALNEDGGLGPDYARRSVQQIARRLRRESVDYTVSVAPQDLHVLAQPVPVPPRIYQVRHPGYRALLMTEVQYGAIKEKVLSRDTRTSVEQMEVETFPEGLLVERLHKSRERNRRVVDKAKQQFIDEHGQLACEACGLEPEKHFRSADMRNRIIEAHHDVALSDDMHEGETRISDLRMLCPNCHRAIHATRPWLSVEDLKRRFRDIA